MTRTVLIMAGGTGGHIFPALAAARVLRERGFEPVWLGTEHGMEARLVPPAKIAMEWISFSGVRGKGLKTWLLAPFRLARAVGQSMQVIKRRRPDVVLGAGGFVSGPGGIAAWLLKKPLVIHEQNAVAGMTNKMLARVATRVLEAFPKSFPAAIQAQAVGNPVRREIVNVQAPRERFADRQGPIRLFVFGGSQGSARLNSTVPAALALLPESLRPQVVHQAGERHFQSTSQSYTELGVTAEVRAFIDDMAHAYTWCDLVICRSGALTVSELAAAGIGAVFVPFALAVDDHQTKNAQFLVQADAGVLIAERDLTPQRLADELQKLLVAGRARLSVMAQNARSQAIVDADVRLADACVAASGVGA
jgi:UDP-N-acetylglucosamine--N-acetylmuramyl-(pentapeptide) pyrophosphoryl-undecaprenol N-acetylglucosamine transferase